MIAAVNDNLKDKGRHPNPASPLTPARKNTIAHTQTTESVGFSGFLKLMEKSTEDIGFSTFPAATHSPHPRHRSTLSVDLRGGLTPPRPPPQI